MMRGRPPMSDDDDDDDYYCGFSFGGDEDYTRKKKNNSFFYRTVVLDPQEELYNHVCNGELDELIEKIDNLKFDINKSVDKHRFDLTLLHYACSYGKLNIVNYLLNNNANPNLQCQSDTPLMQACANYNENSKEIVELLLEKGAVLDVSNKLGMTPFMFACKHGNLDIVKILINDVSLEACDNEGKTVLFHAIENNHFDIVQFLIDSGINCKIFDRKGYTPLQVAQNFGFHDIYEILPKEESKYIVPTSYLCYNSLNDYIPMVLKSEMPAYFPEIDSILKEINSSEFVENFALAKINLFEFLTITDKRLEEIGIKFPYQRNRIRFGLLFYHLEHWSKKSIVSVKRGKVDNFYEILMLTADQLKNLVIINSTIKFVEQNLEAREFGKINNEEIKNFRNIVQEYKEKLLDFNKTVKYLHSFSPEKPPLLIEYDDEKKSNNKMKCYIKYSILVGVSIAVYLKFGSTAFTLKSI